MVCSPPTRSGFMSSRRSPRARGNSPLPPERTSPSDTASTFIAAMDVEAVSEGDVRSGGNGEFPRARGLLLELMKPERVGGEQTIVAHVPPGRMARILRVIEDGHADDLPVHRAVVIAPGGALAPGRAVPHAFAVHDVAGRFVL